MVEITPIKDPADPRLAPYRDIRERDLVGREGLFVAEGEVVLRKAVAAGVELASVLLAEKRVAAFAGLIDALPDATPVYAAAQGVMDAVAGFAIHRGVLAIGAKPAPLDPEALLAGLPPRARVLVLCAIANHDNMGGLFRNAAAFGVEAVLLDSDCCDPFYRKAIRVSVGAVLTTRSARLAAGADVLGLLARHGFESLALSPSGAVALRDLEPPARVAVILGAEGPGLPPEILARARTVSIPMAVGFDSLNVAVTAGIVLHHLAL